MEQAEFVIKSLACDESISWPESDIELEIMELMEQGVFITSANLDAFPDSVNTLSEQEYEICCLAIKLLDADNGLTKLQNLAKIQTMIQQAPVAEQFVQRAIDHAVEQWNTRA